MMRLRAALASFALAALSVATAGPALASVGERAVTVRRLHPKAIVVGSGETYGDTVLALASQRGLVVVDTGLAPSLTRAYRAAIEEELGRSDFTWVVNTHYHFDHTDGNQVFPDATVVGLEETRERMLEWESTRADFVAAQRTRVEGWWEQLQDLEPDSQPAARLRDLVYSYARMCDDLEGNFHLRPPTLTFSNRLTLRLGDLTLQLYAFGPGTHTGDDILVHVPEIGLVASGDLFSPGTVRLLFRLEEGIDVPHKLAVLDAVLADRGLEHVVTIHNGVMTRADLMARRNYQAALWEAATAVAAEGGTLADLHRHVDLATDFPYLADLGIPAEELHRQHLDAVATTWLVANDAENGAAAIQRVLDESDIGQAWSVFDRMLPSRGQSFLIDEGAFNALGYRLLRAGRVDEAIAVFEMNVQAFPDTWNTHDSLGEGLAARGDTERAIASYRRSLELNPDNANAAEWLDRLHSQE